MRSYKFAFTVVFLFTVSILQGFPVPGSLDAALRSAEAGDVVELGFSSTGSIRAVNAVPNGLTGTEGTLLYSDDPETAGATGILYQETLPAGRQRVYLYHVNGTGQNRRFSIVAENATAEAAIVTMQAWSFPVPSGNYIGVGREGVRQFYENTALPGPVVIEPGGRAILALALDGRLVAPNQLAAAILDYESTQPLVVSTVMVASGADTLASFPSLPFAPNDGANRQGTFPNVGRVAPGGVYTFSTSEGIVKLGVANGSNDPHAPGFDAERMASTILLGNYGVTYDVEFAVRNDARQHLAVLVNPRGGNYGGYFRTTLNGDAAEGQLVPASSLVVPPTTSGGVIALLDTPPGASTVRLEFIPAGASSLPIEILFVPYGDPAPVKDWWVVY